MGKNLPPAPPPQAVALPGTVTPTALTLPATLDYPSWEAAGRLLGKIGHGVQWWAGDFLIYGQRRFGEQFAQGADVLGYDAKTLVNLAWVAERIPPAGRRAGLSFAHHAEVAALPPAEQDAWLTKAETEGWTRHQLRKALKGVKEPDDEPEPCKLHHCKNCEATWAGT